MYQFAGSKEKIQFKEFQTSAVSSRQPALYEGNTTQSQIIILKAQALPQPYFLMCTSSRTFGEN